MELTVEHKRAIATNGRGEALMRRAADTFHHIGDRAQARESGAPFLCRSRPGGRWGSWPLEYDGWTRGELCDICWQVFQAPERAFPDVEAFYQADPRRRVSAESGFGCYWRGEYDGVSRWSLSYIQNTGEVYAYREHFEPRLLLLLGVVPPAEEVMTGNRCLSFDRSLEAVLEGWTDHCSKPGSLGWVIEMMADYRLLETGGARR